jgi:hypothetical protein
LTPVSELLARFTEPAAEYGPLPLWWWSGATLTRPRLRRQMEQLLAQGVTQAVVICLAPGGPTYGCLADDPPFLSARWLELLDAVCEDAHELGFRLWMYDQLGFSGANIQGALVARRPEFAGVTLRRREDGEIEEAPSGYDYFGVEACRALLDSVHGTLERHVGRWFGSVIPGFFQDELPALPTWGHDFGESFESEHGYDLWPRRAALFEGSEPESCRARRDYHEHRASLARRAFFDPLTDWLQERGLVCGFDQQSPAREGDPIGGVRLYGDYLTTHAGYQLPGTDHWGDPKVHSSLAHAYGHPRTWFEAFHSTGWGGTLEETFDWLAPALRRGATLYNPHAVYYATVGGWWEWAAPSTCWRQPYWQSYGVFASAIRRLCSVLTMGTHVCDVVLVSPTTTVQAHLTLDGPLPAAREAAACYHALNGTSCWFAEERGLLERAGIDHDVFDERVLAAAEVVDGELRVGDESYRGVVLPNVDRLLAGAAGKLIEFARQGGTLVCVGKAPPELAGVARVVDAPDDVPAEFGHLPAIRADAPYLLRRVGDLSVLLLVAHDERSGTGAPIVELGATAAERAGWEGGDDWGRFWSEYRRQLHESGYDFIPPSDRVAHVRIAGLACSRAQRWDARTGQRAELAVDDTGEAALVDVPFLDGPIALVVLGDDLPDAVSESNGEPSAVTSVDGPWLAVAESTLDNAHGDLAAADRAGRLPIELWRLEHSTDDGWQPVLASFGPFASVAGEDGTWSSAEWSLSRGVHKDPVHGASLGPKGYVPEEFLVWRHVAAGGRVRARTYLPLPSRDGLHLAVGANASRRVVVDRVELAVDGEGYQSFSELPSAAGRTVCVELELTAERDGPVRASLAVVADRERYRRPAWLAGDELTREFLLDELPSQATVQIASHGACAVFVNDTEVGRQGEFEPYAENSPARAFRYDVRSALRTGRNTIALRLGAGAAAAVDSRDLPVVSGSDWSGGLSDRDTHGYDPRFVCVDPRPHPLPGAAWLDAAARDDETVVPVIPQLAPDGERTELLRFAAPLGLVAFKLPTDLTVVAEIAGSEHRPVDGWVRLAAPLPAGTPVLLRVVATDGRRGGALLDHGLELELAETETELRSWEELGLRALGGDVRYRTSFDARGGRRTVIDLGAVRGAADVLVNDTLVDRLIFGPWRADVTGAIESGENRLEVVVRGTLAGYLDDTSPTMEIVAGQVRTGLFGPVRLLEYAGFEEAL